MFHTKTKYLIGLLAAVILAAAWHNGLLGAETAYAQAALTPGTGAAVRGSLGEDIIKLVQKLAFINTFLHVILLVVLNMMQYLLQADFFNDPTMMGALNTIWQLSRNIMNVVFAVMLIGGSFYVMITASTEKVNDKVRNFVVAVILVNFSWFFPRVIIDVANVLTATVFSIPSALPNFTCRTLDNSTPPKPVPCKVVVDATIFPTPAQATAFCPNAGDPDCKCITGLECHKTEDFDVAVTHMSAGHAMINGIVVSFARITQLSRVPTTLAIAGGGPIGTGRAASVSLQIAFSVLLSLVIQLAVVLPMIGLAIGLPIPIVIIWVTTAFMPFTFLGYVINGKLGTDVFGFEVNVWQEFINAAFLPAVVAVPFVIGFIMLSTVAQIPAPLGSFTQTFNVPIINGVTSWWTLLWMIAAIAIIWTGSFKALAKNKIVGQFTDKLKGYGEYVFKGVAQLPLLTPLPLPGGGKGNLGTALNLPKFTADAIRAKASGRTDKSLGELIQDAVGGKKNAATEAAKLNAASQTKLANAIDELSRGVNKDKNFTDIRKEFGLSSTTSEKETLEFLKQVASNTAAGGTLNNDAVKRKLDAEIAKR